MSTHGFRRGRGPTSREVTLAWSIELDAEGYRRGQTSPLFDGTAPSELLDWTVGAFAANEHEGDRWTFLCLLHDDDWANGDGDALAKKLAKLADGVVIAAHMERLVNAWLLRKGVAREVTPLPDLAFAPAPTMKATRKALATIESALAALPRPKATPFARLLPALVAKHVTPFDLEATDEPLHYRFAARPNFELRFVPRKRRCVPMLAHVGGATRELRELPGTNLDEELSALGSRSYDALAVQWPLLLAEHGEVVPASELVPALREVRWELKRIAEAPGTHADVIQTCVDFLLSGVWDDTARENVIRLVQHANCLQRACADRLQRA